MNPTERVMAVLEGQELDRVQTLSVILDEHPIHQILGFPSIKDATLLFNPVSRFLLDHTNIGKHIMRSTVDTVMFKSIEAAVALGFDACWGYLALSFVDIPDSKTILDCMGFYHDLIDDGHGNSYYMYRKPLIASPEDYAAWPHFPDPDDWAHKTFDIYKKAHAKFGDKICICGEVSTDIYDFIQCAMGFENFAIYMHKDLEFLRRWVASLEEFAMKTTMAMMDAGLKVILKGDDMAFKTGPQMNPKAFDDLVGPSYTRLCKAVHDRGGKILLHACGDNTKLFDYFIKWGFDGGHAFETTSNVDIPYEKKTHGDRFTIVGGVGIDYLLTERSKPEEVVEATKDMIRVCAPGGRFLLAPVHCHPDLDISKVKIMLDTARKHGTYPLNL